MNNNDIINSIRSNNIPLKCLLIIKNRLEDLAGRIAIQIEADSLVLLKAMMNPEFLDKNGFSKETALGMYIPNSYEVFWNISADGFRDKMLKEYNSFWNNSRLAKAKALNLSRRSKLWLWHLLYMKNLSKDREQPRVAGVILNRLKIGMPLQADPTVKFARIN